MARIDYGQSPACPEPVRYKITHYIYFTERNTEFDTKSEKWIDPNLLNSKKRYSEGDRALVSKRSRTGKWSIIQVWEVR